jgi:NAD(P)H-flavin reductase
MGPENPMIPVLAVSRLDLADGLAIVTLSLDRDFLFEPGQHATLWLTHRGRTIPRPYSVASSPRQPRRLEFYLNLVAEGQMTPSLWDPEVIRALETHAKGTTLAVTGPKGRFCLISGDTRDLVLIASGTGLAPFMSMIRKLEEDSADKEGFRPRRVYVIHGVTRSVHLGYREELEKLAVSTMSNPQRRLAVIYLPTVSRPNLDPAWGGLKGRAESLLEDSPEANVCPSRSETSVRAMLRVLLRPETHAVYVCGHPGTVGNTVRILTARGYRLDKDLMRERFFPDPAGTHVATA